MRKCGKVRTVDTHDHESSAQNLAICPENRYQARSNRSAGLDARVTEGHMA